MSGQTQAQVWDSSGTGVGRGGTCEGHVRDRDGTGEGQVRDRGGAGVGQGWHR